MKTGEMLKQTEEQVKRLLSNDATGHDWWHIYRVRRNAVRIGMEEQANLFVVELAALLHDIADWKFHDGDENAGPREARRWLETLGVDHEVIEQICTAIDEVSFKGAGVDTTPSTLEGKVVQDADRLDALGAVGIARAFAYGGHKGREIHNPDILPIQHNSFQEYKTAHGTTINHFYEKLLLLKDRMNTPAGRRRALARHEYLVKFLEQFNLEWEGKI